ncbi:MAG: hypothetical protein K6E59_04530 [Bacilli bacterium]|nr:hypothetical protein [Bacilli bacterium]
MQPLKMFGLGILWALLFPFILVGIVIVGVFGVVDFLIEFVIMVINFFRGKKLFPVYKEDEEAYNCLQKALDKQNAAKEAQAVPPAPQQVFVQQNFYTNPGAVPPAPGTPLPPGYVPPQVGQPNYGQIPQPGYGTLPPQQPQAPAGYIPPQPAQEQIPPRPELAKLPNFDASEYGNKTDTIEIDIDEGGEGDE